MSQLEFYTARAEEAHAGARASTLDNERDRWLGAAAAWEALAARARKTDTFRASELERKAMAPAA